MQKNITARHFDLTDEMRDRCESEMEGLTRFYENIISADFILEIEKHRRTAELRVKVYNSTITGTGESGDLYNSISAAVDKVRGQLIKYKGKMKDKKPDEIHETISNLTRPSTDVDEVDV